MTCNLVKIPPFLKILSCYDSMEDLRCVEPGYVDNLDNDIVEFATEIQYFITEALYNSEELYNLTQRGYGNYVLTIPVHEGDDYHGFDIVQFIDFYIACTRDHKEECYNTIRKVLGNKMSNDKIFNDHNPRREMFIYHIYDRNSNWLNTTLYIKPEKLANYNKDDSNKIDIHIYVEAEKTNGKNESRGDV